jgi:hypothetical protein
LTTRASYSRARRPAIGEPEHIRDILAPFVADLAERIERRAGVRYLVQLALGMHRAGAEGFADVEPLQLVAELAELARFEDPQP